MSEIQVDTRQPRGNDEKKKANVDNIGDTLLVEEGIAKPEYAIQIRKTPPWAENQTIPWMIFDGECRYLAAGICGATSIFAEVIVIPEEQVFERQVLTAMAREGLTASAQLEALRRFDADHAEVNAANAAARLGMSASVVRSLRKVNILPADVRLRYMGGEHTLEVCDSLSRIEGATAEERAERQSQASKAVAGMTPRKAKEYITSQFLLRLADAPFDREDATLNQEAGVCSACPHRTAAQTGLFAETDAGDDCCKRPECWGKKVAATIAKAPRPEEKTKPTTTPGKPTKEDVLVAAALAAGKDPEELDGTVGGWSREDIDASLERLAAHGNPKARPALLDRKAKGQDLCGYSRGSAWAIAQHALDGVRVALGSLADADLSRFAMDVSSLIGAHVMRATEMTLEPSPLACEPGGEPPPPPPVTTNGDEEEFVDWAAPFESTNDPEESDLPEEP